ncbi:MAG: T9SS type A sorting domain-containing protein [Flavobacteriaceae bacterium]
MKKSLVFLVFLFALQSNAQDPQLFDNTWYLEKLTINEIDYVTPYLEYVIEETNFQQTPAMLDTGYCDMYGAELEYNTTQDEFTILTVVEMGGPACGLIESIEFNNLYGNFWMDPLILNTVMGYSITNESNYKTLTLTKFNNDKAIYRNQSLGINTLNKKNFSFYPNPVDDFLKIATPPESLHYKIYSLSGQQLKQGDYPETGIDTSSFAPGIYFLNIIHEGESIFIKFIKN